MPSPGAPLKYHLARRLFSDSLSVQLDRLFEGSFIYHTRTSAPDYHSNAAPSAGAVAVLYRSDYILL
jgi:hypothetical protein